MFHDCLEKGCLKGYEDYFNWEWLSRGARTEMLTSPENGGCKCWRELLIAPEKFLSLHNSAGIKLSNKSFPRTSQVVEFLTRSPILHQILHRIWNIQTRTKIIFVSDSFIRKVNTRRLSGKSRDYLHFVLTSLRIFHDCESHDSITQLEAYSCRNFNLFVEFRFVIVSFVSTILCFSVCLLTCWRVCLKLSIRGLLKHD